MLLSCVSGLEGSSWLLMSVFPSFWDTGRVVTGGTSLLGQLEQEPPGTSACGVSSGINISLKASRLNNRCLLILKRCPDCRTGGTCSVISILFLNKVLNLFAQVAWLGVPTGDHRPSQEVTLGHVSPALPAGAPCWEGAA